MTWSSLTGPLSKMYYKFPSFICLTTSTRKDFYMSIFCHRWLFFWWKVDDNLQNLICIVLLYHAKSMVKHERRKHWCLNDDTYKWSITVSFLSNGEGIESPSKERGVLECRFSSSFHLKRWVSSRACNVYHLILVEWSHVISRGTKTRRHYVLKYFLKHFSIQKIQKILDFFSLFIMKWTFFRIDRKSVV